MDGRRRQRQRHRGAACWTAATWRNAIGRPAVSAGLRQVLMVRRSGAITGCRARIDTARLGGGFAAFVAVEPARRAKASRPAFKRAVALSNGVVERRDVTRR